MSGIFVVACALNRGHELPGSSLKGRFDGAMKVGFASHLSYEEQEPTGLTLEKTKGPRLDESAVDQRNIVSPIGRPRQERAP